MSKSWLEEWIEKAEEDFEAINSLDPARLPGIICFHCQQCIEKYLKAGLIKHGMPTRKTHNLIKLVDLLVAEDSAFEQMREAARELTPYAVEPRYPSWQIAEAEAKEAVAIMENARATLRDLLDLPAEPNGLDTRS